MHWHGNLMLVSVATYSSGKFAVSNLTSNNRPPAFPRMAVREYGAVHLSCGSNGREGARGIPTFPKRCNEKTQKIVDGTVWCEILRNQHPTSSEVEVDLNEI